MVLFDGILYPTAEHAYQAHKTENIEERKQIAKLSTPGKAKRYSKSVKLRDNWEQIKIAVMKEAVTSKFERNENLRKLLLETGKETLVEGNNWGDEFWGVYNGKGRNELGQILMLVRKFFA